jgi:starvation-inducible DNA-binding protein
VRTSSGRGQAKAIRAGVTRYADGDAVHDKDPKEDTMTVTFPTTAEHARLTAASALQKVLPELVGLTLNAKQAHWNIVGPNFLPLHALTDDVAADARGWADRVAERAVALGFTVDARPGTVAATASQFPAGRVVDREAISELVELIGDVAETVRATLGDLEQADIVAHDLIVEILEGLDKYAWMLRAQSL